MIGVIDYGLGNLASISNMLRRIDVPTVISSDPNVLATADKLILPGVGAFDQGMKNLHKSGLIEPLNRWIQQDKKPILGICLGAQLLTLGSDEGKLPGLGWIRGRTVAFNRSRLASNQRVPNMGWRNVYKAESSHLISSLSPDARFYFVHSFHLQIDDPHDVILTANHGYPFAVGVQHDNVMGVQFHPEKSHKFGMEFLRSFAIATPQSEVGNGKDLVSTRDGQPTPFERIRVIPSLLLRGEGLVKTVRFQKPVYVGDPINTVKIFNEKQVDEIAILDITASHLNREPQFERIAEIASEAFMPLAYGGGIRTLEQIKRLFQLGVEKVILNTALIENPDLVTAAANQFGSQSILASIDAKKKWLGGYYCVTRGGRQKHRISPVVLARRAVDAGAGEVLLNSVNRDGTQSGYDIALIRSVTKRVNVPVIACGGAKSVADFVQAVHDGGASAVAAGSMFVFHGIHRAVLVNFPDEHSLQALLFNQN
jgi:cyclase